MLVWAFPGKSFVADSVSDQVDAYTMRIKYMPRAVGQIEALTVSAQKRIITKMEFFIEQPAPLKHAKHLVGYDAYRFRIGDYRVVCKTDEDMLVVLFIDKRDGVYKNL